MEILYDEYCKGYNFLRYIALTYITTSDIYQEDLKVNPYKLIEYRGPVRKEAQRIFY